MPGSGREAPPPAREEVEKQTPLPWRATTEERRQTTRFRRPPSPHHEECLVDLLRRFFELQLDGHVGALERRFGDDAKSEAPGDATLPVRLAESIARHASPQLSFPELCVRVPHQNEQRVALLV